MAGVAAKIGYKIVGGLTGLVVGVVVRKALAAGWAAARGSEPPDDPATRAAAPLTEALAWTIASGAAFAAGKLVAERGAAGIWVRATGKEPPGHPTAEAAGRNA